MTPHADILIEPSAKNTGAAICAAALALDARATVTLMLIAHSNHVIPNAELFRKSVHAAFPAAIDGSSGGQREFVPVLARAAVAVGVGALFMEVHEDPDNAPSDGPNMVRINELKDILKRLVALQAHHSQLLSKRQQSGPLNNVISSS
jgi:3-deoxy-D-manno-octulosonic acid (KDO) 8-phosphate synthase